ncbi:unnamed protein product, partial [Thelazia callipaeda]|uniref:non-specific serine/threonine protein kinase n=1 Tax=Thelazia callipaeda TaxID=103827 RepID=A0A0N5DAL8_THECL
SENDEYNKSERETSTARVPECNPAPEPIKRKLKLRSTFYVFIFYPKSLISAWEEFDKQFQSENDHPRIFNSYQHYLLLAFEDGGTDLEKYVSNISQAYSIIYQVITALSVAEHRLSFEHRDLHCGNIMIKNVEAYYADCKINLLTHGVELKIIDFTLSRMSKGTSTIFFDLAKDNEIFSGENCLQFDIYRAMRKANMNNWFPFYPVTNVMWIIYLVRYVYDSLVNKNIGSHRERQIFIHHFRDLHRFGNSHSFISLHSRI